MLIGLAFILGGAAVVGAVAGGLTCCYEWWKAGDEPFSQGKLFKRTIEGSVLGVLTVGIAIAGPVAGAIGVPIPPGIPGQVVKAIDPWLDKLYGLDWKRSVRDPLQPLRPGAEGPTANEVRDWLKELKLPKIGGGPPCRSLGLSWAIGIHMLQLCFQRAS